MPKHVEGKLNAAISILAGAGGEVLLSVLVFVLQGKKVSLPNGLYLHYHNLRQTTDGWLYDHAGEPRRLYGGALLENIVQALARIVVMDASTRIKKQLKPYGIGLALQVHDALVYVVPDELVAYTSDVLAAEMNATSETGQPELILAAELKTGSNYGECK